ncbi:MAG: NFACT family protein [Bacteroidota bacterium]
MVTHYFTLHALCRELEPRLRNSQIQEVFTQQKDELYISVAIDDGISTLSISVDPSLNHFLLRENVNRAKKNSVDLFPDLVGKIITRIGMLGFDRTVEISFEESADTLLLQLYNSARSNVFLVDGEKIILEAFKHGKTHAGKQLASPQQRSDEMLTLNKSDWMNYLHGEDMAIYAALKIKLPFFGSTYIRETLYRAGVEEKSLSSLIDELALEKIFAAIRAINSEREKPCPAIYFRDDHPAVFSVLPLNHLSGLRVEIFENINQAVKICLTRIYKQQHSDSGKKELFGKLKTIADRSRRTVDSYDRQARESSRAAEYERMGSIIMGNLDQIAKGMSSAELPDIISGEGTAKITLDPKLSPVKNAERYFDKAKKTKSALKDNAVRSIEAQKESKLLEAMVIQLEECETPDQLKDFTDTYRIELTKLHLLRESADKNKPPFRIFTVAGGFEVWVGKSSANNDLLTMKFSKPNDLWFHARGSSGSHTVLKVPDTSHPPGKEAITQAASIAAYYSKMRNASNVPVAYCERKYVRKSKGLAEGAVFLEREKVIFVTPRLPQTDLN